MPEYIEREAALALIEERQRAICPLGRFSRNAIYGTDRDIFDAWQEIVDQIDAIPAADVVEVVRCRECRYFRADAIPSCVFTYGLTDPKPNGFCSYGKRRK